MRGVAPGNAPGTHLEQVMGGIASTRKTQSAPNMLSLGCKHRGVVEIMSLKGSKSVEGKSWWEYRKKFFLRPPKLFSSRAKYA